MPADRPGPCDDVTGCPPDGPPLTERLDELRASWGVDFPAARAVLAMLAAGEPGDVTALVEATALPRRRVQGILRALERWTTSEGDTAVLDPASAAALRSWLARLPAPGPLATDLWDGFVQEAPELVARLGELTAGLPPSQWRLDHVPATPETIAKRAVYLTRTYALHGAHLLCVGDHDLTSLAVTLAEPSARATVVDVDERLLAYIDASARRFGVDVTCARADLRLGLPRSLAGTADLAFTDPPYTPAGIGLFVRRGLEGLRRATPTRLVFCYGFGDRGAGRAVEVQGLATDLGLALDAIHPNFSAYRGAEAIGSRSHLYVTRPTRTTWPALDRRRRLETLIYTRGPEAEERGGAALRDETAAVVAGTLDGGPLTLVGDGWPPAGLPAAGEARRLRLDEYLERSRPPVGAVAVNLFPEFGAALVPVVLSTPDRLTLVVGGRSWRATGLGRTGDPVGRFLGATFDFRVLRPGERAETVVEVRRRTDPAEGPVAALHRYLVGHGSAKAVNAWREGLVHVAAGSGVTLSKNAARAAVAATGPGRSLDRLRLEELPRHALAELAELSARSLHALAGPGGPTDSPEGGGPVG